MPVNYNLKEKVIIVTGASQGIGKSIAAKLAMEKARVVLISRNETKLSKINDEFKKYGCQSIYIPADISDLDQLTHAIEHIKSTWGTIDGIINNAGITDDNLIVRMKLESFENVINTNLKGVFNGIKAVSKIMIKNNYGRIINISSVIAQIGNKGQSNYSASKAGVIGLTKSIAKELAPKNITVNAIAPGYIKTEMTEKLNEKNREKLLNFVPLNRFGEPEDVANLVCFLLSDQAQYITGQTINVDGGMVMQS
tara:strand:- start:11 stop:769 length:759 start_codon:yes stop_codon:yes gene_type:complete